MERKKEGSRDGNMKAHIFKERDGQVTLCDLYVVATADTSRFVTQMKYRGKGQRPLSVDNTYLSVDSWHNTIAFVSYLDFPLWYG